MIGSVEMTDATDRSIVKHPETAMQPSSWINPLKRLSISPACNM